MEKYLRKYILGEAKRLPQLRKELKQLQEIQRIILVTSKGTGLSGQPKAKYSYGDSTSDKALEQVFIANRIKHIERELAVFEGTRKELTGRQKTIYEKTILFPGNITAIANLMGIGERTLYSERGKILLKLAVELELYLSVDNLVKKY